MVQRVTLPESTLKCAQFVTGDADLPIPGKMSVRHIISIFTFVVKVISDLGIIFIIWC
jgi:hypothetical protein